MDKFYKVKLGPAECAVDLCDGSERGEYVNQDYVLRKLGRPHRSICLMYCYYPDDPAWPARASVAYKHDGAGAWDYPYDDYFPYMGGKGGDRNAEPFKSMRDVRRHGQDVMLTLTIDPFLDDERLAAVARDLRTFGRVTVRINHEATGNWFSFNKRAGYEEVAAFFVRACETFHREAPNCRIILCLDGCKDPKEEKMIMEDIFTEAAKAADIVSVDRYLALHWGYPADICEDNSTSMRENVKSIYELCKKSYSRYIVMNDGVIKPMVLAELNADADVTGPYDQAEMMQEFAELLKADKDKWLNGYTFYMFRDRGRLGLEIEDPNNPEVGIEQPVLKSYKKQIQDPFFYPELKVEEEEQLPVTLRWGGFEDSEGIAMPVHLEANPVFFEAYFEGDLADANLMLAFDGHWYYKAPGVTCIDMSDAYFENPLTGPKDITVTVFAPPATGENDPSQGEDWQENYYYELKSLPKLRIRYGAIIPKQ